MKGEGFFVHDSGISTLTIQNLVIADSGSCINLLNGGTMNSVLTVENSVLAGYI